MNTSAKEILEKIRQSSVYTEYKEAFQKSLDLPLTLRSVETWGLPLQGRANENPFCALMAQDGKSCNACLGMQQKLGKQPATETATLTCFAGFRETVVPIRHCGKTVGFLQTGQVRHLPPTREDFEKVCQQLDEWGAKLDRAKLEKAFFSAPAISEERYESMVTLLKQFATHLELVTNQIIVQNENSETPIVRKARKFIEENYSEDIRLEDVAKTVHTSIFYFCKIFKKATGLTFTEYLTRIRVERAKEILLSPQVRISEAAFAVGFQSLSQFNRAFRKIVGSSPTEYRQNLPQSRVA